VTFDEGFIFAKECGAEYIEVSAMSSLKII
jgi:hypothetical protein